MKRLIILPALLAFVAARPADWPCLRGPQHDGVSTEKGVLDGVGKDGPKLLWRYSIGVGFASIAVCGDRLYTMGSQGGTTDIVYCFDIKEGKVLWRHSYPCNGRNSTSPLLFEGGPCATPTVSGNDVFILSREGHAMRLNAKTGEVIWQHDTVARFGARIPEWGFAGSPTIDGDNLIVHLGAKGA